MPSCEKCWRDAGTISASAGTRKVEEYARLIGERDCTPEEQAGDDAGTCPKCDRKTLHQICGVCMACGYESRVAAPAAKEEE